MVNESINKVSKKAIRYLGTFFFAGALFTWKLTIYGHSCAFSFDSFSFSADYTQC